MTFINKKLSIALIIIIVIVVIFYNYRFNDAEAKITNEFSNKNVSENEETITNSINDEIANEVSASSQEKYELVKLDKKGKNYSFIYKDEVYSAIYTKDNWHIVDSYKIINKNDIIKICEILIEEHPIHGKDMKSYRTAEDLAIEWIQHNFAYEILSEDSQWKDNAKDVDLNPNDQGKSLEEMYEDRTGKEIDFQELYNKVKRKVMTN